VPRPIEKGRTKVFARAKEDELGKFSYPIDLLDDLVVEEEKLTDEELVDLKIKRQAAKAKTTSIKEK